MSDTWSAAPLFEFDNSFARDLPELYVAWNAATVPRPELVALNEPLAVALGLDPDDARSPQGVAVLAGNAVPAGASPLAQVYAGHQFGGFSPRLGDGRALLLGEVLDAMGKRHDVQLKGSGRTPFARAGDGKAALGPMLREYLIGEALHALGIPTTRALAVVTTGETIPRQGMLPGAVLTRVAASHLRVGTFEYAVRTGDVELLRRLADHAIARHYPDLAAGPRPYLALLRSVAEAQASLVARWMLVGFIHGVMNTDNMTISGESIDFGPCAFIEAYDPHTVFSSIDHGGRYAYGNQPAIAQWNLARLAESLLALIDDGHGSDAAVADAMAVLNEVPAMLSRHWRTGMAHKLGLAELPDDDPTIAHDLLDLMRTQQADYTSTFTALAACVRGQPAAIEALLGAAPTFDDWHQRWRVAHRRLPAADIADRMDTVNPVHIPRNHLVEEALSAASDHGDMGPFDRLLAAIRDPFATRQHHPRLAAAAPDAFTRCYQTFCGT